MRLACLLLAVLAGPDIARAAEFIPNLPGVFFSPNAWSVGGTLTLDLLDDAQGGRNTGLRYLDKLTVDGAYDGNVEGFPGLSGVLSFQYVGGGPFSDAMSGDIQTLDNIDASQGARLYEAWLARAFAGGAYGVKVGMIDLNTEFDVQETAALFLNSSFGIGPDFSQSGPNGPSIFPTTALAVTAFAKFADGWTLRGGIFDGHAGDPEHPSRFAVTISEGAGALSVAQIEKRWSDWRVEAGVWTYTAKFDALDEFDAGGSPKQLRGNSGVYGLIEDKLYTPDGAPDRGLSGWLRLGYADPDINPIETFIGAGIVYTGLIPGREQDQAGLAVASARFGSPARDVARVSGAGLQDAETTIEATYSLQPIRSYKWLIVQPDVQYVIDPSGNPALKNALVVGLRFRLAGAY